MRRRGRVDANQAAVAKALRDAGATVAVTSGLGAGFPDLVAGVRGVNHLIEVKDGSKPPSARKLTPDEAAFHAGWRGRVIVVTSPAEAVAAVFAVTLT